LPAGAAAVHADYAKRRDDFIALSTRKGRQERWLSHTRLVSFLVALALTWFALGTESVSALWIAPAALVFAVLVIAHDRVIRARDHACRAADLYERGLARLEDRWAGGGNVGDEFRDADHPYADDLDVFGEGSLFELLCTARTSAGEQTLARWLLAPAEPEVVRSRQAAVKELSGRVELRQDLALLGEDVRSRLRPTALVRWGSAPAVLDPSPRLRATAAASSALSVAGIFLWTLTEAGPIPFLIATAVQSAFALRLRSRVRSIAADVVAPTRDLALLSGLLERLEGEPMESPRLAELRAAFHVEGAPPSKRIRELQRLTDLLDARRNQLFAPFSALLLWKTQVALGIEAWRLSCGPALPRWLDAVGEIEALCSLSGYAHEHPHDPFPEVVSQAEGPIFDGVAIGHPLLPDACCERNDLSLGGERQAFVVSGSNMSGKSTLLRTVGTNTLLALAGSPVRAKSLRVSPVALAASIRVNDSLQDGTSRFYAEILRLRQVVDACSGDLPVLFLLDEILHGTNSHDRRIGADAIVRGLLERGALGLVTTHDLALAKIADELAPQIENIHFEDHIEDGEIHFDYQLRQGVVTKSNALALMRAVGLDV